MIGTFVGVFIVLVLLCLAVVAGCWGLSTLLDGDGAGWRVLGGLSLLGALVIVAGLLTVAFTNEDRRAPCVKSHQVWITGVPYEVCDERAVPVKEPR